MRKRIDRKNRSDEGLARVHSIEKGELQVQVLEYEKPCGHPGYLAEVYLRDRNKDEVAQVGCFGFEDLQLAILLLQEAAEFIGERSGYCPLPTVRLWGKSFFVDGRLKEMRNFENLHERILLRDDL